MEFPLVGLTGIISLGRRGKIELWWSNPVCATAIAPAFGSPPSLLRFGMEENLGIGFAVAGLGGIGGDSTTLLLLSVKVSVVSSTEEVGAFF